MNRIALRALKPLIVLLTLGALTVQVLIIPFIADEAGKELESPATGIFYGATGILAILCMEVALVAMWKLLTLVSSDAIFHPDSLRWVDLIVRVGWAATALCVVVAGHWQFFIADGPLSVPLVLFGSAVTALAVTLLMTVMRQLLVSAMDYRSELLDVV